jgi:uncharacterized RDD family membrane protein YckC/type II secretory pathway pseudopilin PulG
MFCPNCGQPVAETSPFCTHCGTHIVVAPAQPTSFGALQEIYAGFWKRFAALLIDSLITGAMGFVVGFFIGLAGAFSHMEKETVQFFSSLAGFVIGVLYFVLMESSEKQATFGKMALGIKVTGLDGARITPLRALGRYFAKILSGLTLCIGYVMAGFTARKQALHDMVAGTLVVKRDADAAEIRSAPVAASSGLSAGAIVAIVLGVLAIPVIGILAAIAIPAYQDYTARSKMASVVAYAHLVTQAVENYYQRHNAIPASIEETGLAAPSEPTVRDAYINPNNGVVTLAMNFKPIEGGKLIFIPSEDAGGNITWTCRSDEIKEKYLPGECR